ncbi:major facilitator superfamily domain-containing protein [Syncephalastrum racemosum]|uniref:Major facilitator superfamily domain-containing protein n=1 Tax=Syncephalastrum racemosum TaxID=13706 RepID=A0A1X2H7J6_SYNRA|nr:major facilitator superfamily domain-containing protein [Syncephalastrum racemosum]
MSDINRDPEPTENHIRTLENESDTSTLEDTPQDRIENKENVDLDKTRCYTSWIKYALGDIYADDDPNDLSDRRKNIIIAIVAFGGVSGPLGSMIYMPALLSVARDLHTTSSAVNGTVSAYVIFMGVAPLIWASLSEQYGRKRMYFISNLISVVTSIICAFAKNIGVLIFFRAIQSAGANAGLTLGAGVIADTIPVARRGKAYGFFYIGPLVGPVIGPTIGGFLCQYLGWQSTFVFQAILGGILLVITTVLLPETLRKGKIQQKNTQGAWQQLKRDFKPMFVMMRDKTVILITTYHTIVFASLYFLNPTITNTFQKLYGYTEWQVGLCYLPLGIGLMIGSIVSGQQSDAVLNKAIAKGCPGKSELRLRASYPASSFIPAGYIIYGWTTQMKIEVYGPLIGLFVYALGQMFAFTPTSVYLVDSKPGSSATAVGITNCVRSIMGAITAIFSTQAIDKAGTGILFTILAVINVLNILLIIACSVFGEKWREQFEHQHGHAMPATALHETKGVPMEQVAATDEEHRVGLHMARITSKHSAL